MGHKDDNENDYDNGNDEYDLHSGITFRLGHTGNFPLSLSDRPNSKFSVQSFPSCFSACAT